MRRTIERTVDMYEQRSTVEYVATSMFLNNDDAHDWVVTVKDNGADAQLTGTISVYVQLPNGDWVTGLDTSVEGNIVTATFNQDCYLQVGQILCTMLYTEGNTRVTLDAFYTFVAPGYDGSAPITPSDKVILWSDVEAKLAEMEASLLDLEELEERMDDVEEAVGSAVRFDGAQTLTEEQKAQARTNIGADQMTGAVRYDASQSLTNAQKTQARSNIGAAASSDIQSLVESVTESDGTVTITKKNGQTTSFVIPQGLAFDGGYLDASDGTLHLTMNGEDIENFDPIDLSELVGGLAFDSGYVDANNLMHLTLEGEDIEGFTPFELPAGGGGGGGSAITLTNVVRPSTIRDGGEAVFGFTATSSDDTDISVVWKVNGQVITTTTGISGAGHTFNAKGSLVDSASNTVRAEITNEGGGSLTRSWTVTSTAFSLSWGAAIQPITLFTENENVFAVVNVAAKAGTSNTVTVSVGEHDAERSVTGSRSVTVELDKTWFETGANTVTANMVSGTDETDTAEEISFIAVWGYGAEDPIVAFADDSLSGTQYDTIPIYYMAYQPGSETAQCTIQIGEESPRTITADRTMHTFNWAPQEAGTYTATLACGESEAELVLTIAESEYDIGMVTGDSLRYNLDPVGHSNADADREQFAGLTFSTGFDWVNGGFRQDDDGAAAFVVKKGHRATLPRSLFADSDANGKVIDVSFRITNSDQYDAVALTDLNNSSTKGLILRANEGEARLDNVAGQIFRYCEDSRIDMSIHVEEQTGQRITTIWLDGIPSKVDAYEAGTLVHSENAAVIGSDHCDVWVYAIRCYNAVLSEREMIQNWIAAGSTTADKVERSIRNSIFDANDKITPETLHAAAPDLTIIEIEADRMTTSKNDPVPADITITDGTTKLELARASAPDAKDGALFKVQGTSSAAYGRSSYNMDLDFKGTGKKYKISADSIQVNYLNIKVNVASSENANNVNAVDWYNTYQPYKIEADARDGVRDTIEAKPCAVFFTNTGNTAAWFSSQLVQPGETILYAMGDLCNSKKNLAVFGEDGEGEHPTMACVEVSGNDTEPERFVTDEGYEYSSSKGAWRTYDGTDSQGNAKYITHFEWRMEPAANDETTAVTAWEDLVSWVVSTIGDSAKFKGEIGDYFAVDSLLYHFLMIEFFAAYDNVSKNTFYSYDWDEDAGKYLWNIKKAYDWDTILAADNDGKPFGDYGIDYGDTVSAGGRSYFNAVDNTIWTNLKAAFQNELSAMYIRLRSGGAWDAAGVIEKWDTYQWKRPHAAMVHDAYIKYVYPYKTSGMVIDGETKGHDDSYLPRMQGSKTYWRRQFMTYQQAYMDGKYGYYSTSNAIAFRTNCASGQEDFVIKCYAKTYITALADANKVASQKIQTGGTATFQNVSVGSNTTIYFTPARLIQYIRPLNETDNSTFVASGATKLMEAILGSEDTNSAWLSGTGLAIPSAILKNLSIRNLENFSAALNLSANTELETLDTRGTNAGRITLPSYGPITSLQLNAVTGIAALNLSKVETFSLESGDNLISVRVENCNSLIMDAMLEYLEDAESSIQYLRMTGINWTLEDTTLLNRLLTVGSISDSGAAGDPPCVLSGHIYVPVVRSGEYAAYEAAWPGVVTYGQLITQYPVTFLNWDNSPILDNQGNAYVQYVDAGTNAYDPIEAEEISTPTRPADAQYTYTFDDWDSLPVGVISSATVHATYTSTTRTYTVSWYDGVGAGNGTLLETKQDISYGSCVKPTDGHPTYTALEGNNLYYVFDGWDKSTGFITGDTIVKARWIIGNLPVAGTKDLKDMTMAEISAVAKNNLASSYWEAKDYFDVKLGQDFHFDNVEDETLISEPVYFDGTASPIIFNGENDLPLIQLFNGTHDRWTLAIEYEFTSTAGVLASCFEDNGNQGFELRNSSSYGNVLWGNVNQNVSYQYIRSIVVIRFNRGQAPQVLYVAREGCTSADVYPYSSSHPETNCTETAHARSTTVNTDAPLTLGGVGYMNGQDVTSLRATGWIHWAKIWYDDLGTYDTKAIGNFTHIPMRFCYNPIQYRDGLDSPNVVAASFLSEGPLPLLGVMNDTGTNLGGWKDSKRRAWMNGQLYDAMPIPLQSIIKPARVRSSAGNKTTDINATMDKLYLPAYAEIFSGQTDNTYKSEMDDQFHTVPWFTNNRLRVKFPGFILPDDVVYVTDPSDPTLYNGTYEVYSEKTVWINTSNSSYGYIYVDADYVAKHKRACARLLTSSDNIAAQGADSNGKTGGIWVRAAVWWLRSPYLSATSSFWDVNGYGSNYNPDAYGAYGLVCGFSI